VQRNTWYSRGGSKLQVFFCGSRGTIYTMISWYYLSLYSMNTQNLRFLPWTLSLFSCTVLCLAASYFFRCRHSRTAVQSSVEEPQAYPTGFQPKTKVERNQLGLYPDYAELSGVPWPEAYVDFDPDRALPRPYRPFRWPYHQTMCTYKYLSRINIVLCYSISPLLTIYPSIVETRTQLVARARKYIQIQDR